MADVQVRQEYGGALIFVGLALWVADLLVVFYLPASVKVGYHSTFVGIIVVMAIAGLMLLIRGYTQCPHEED